MRTFYAFVVALAMMFGVTFASTTQAADAHLLRAYYYEPELKMDDLFHSLIPYENMEPEYQAISDYYKGLFLKEDQYNGVGIKVTRMAMDPVSNMRQFKLYIQFTGRRSECGIVKMDVMRSGSYYKYQGNC